MSKRDNLSLYIEPRLKYLKQDESLYSPLYGYGKFKGVDNVFGGQHFIVEFEHLTVEQHFDLNGRLLYDKYNHFYSDRCMVFPSHKSTPSWRTWFKPGIILYEMVGPGMTCGYLINPDEWKFKWVLKIDTTYPYLIHLLDQKIWYQYANVVSDVLLKTVLKQLLENTKFDSQRSEILNDIQNVLNYNNNGNI